MPAGAIWVAGDPSSAMEKSVFSLFALKLWRCRSIWGKVLKGQDRTAFILFLHNTLCECLKHKVKSYLEFNDAIVPFHSKLQESLITSLRGQAIQLTSKERLEKIITVSK